MEGECPIHGADGCTEKNIHHLYWPRKAYKSQLERLFRRMHTVRICVDWHKHIHATQQVPKKPRAAEMRAAIEAKQAERRQDGRARS